MNTTQIKRAVLAAALLAGAGMAYGDPESALHVVYCKAMITEGGENGSPIVSVTLPPTEGYYDNNGNPLTYWNVGNVPAGGVADSWHGEGGPGRFTARNEGNVGSYFYVTTAGGNYMKFIDTNEGGSGTNFWYYYYGGDQYPTINTETFGTTWELHYPAISPSELRRYAHPESYHLAFTTDTMAKIPTWHSLDHRWGVDRWYTEEAKQPIPTEVAAYMGYVEAGDYLTFDLKFWSSPNAPTHQSALFTFCVEASAFPLWEHGRAVE